MNIYVSLFFPLPSPRFSSLNYPQRSNLHTLFLVSLSKSYRRRAAKARFFLSRRLYFFTAEKGGNGKKGLFLLPPRTLISQKSQLVSFSGFVLPFLAVLVIRRRRRRRRRAALLRLLSVVVRVQGRKTKWVTRSTLAQGRKIKGERAKSAGYGLGWRRSF